MKKIYKIPCVALLHSCVFSSSYAIAGDNNAALEEIVVVGSSIKSNANYDTNSQAVQLIKAEEFGKTSGQHIAQFLHTMPIVSGYNSTTQTSEYTGGNSGINLRGLGEKYTLVLVNGRRAGGRFTADLEAIPTIAIDSIEILKSGASAIYGTDAVAGVANIRLKKDFTGIEFETSYGKTGQNDGDTFQAAMLFGLASDRFSFTGSISGQDNKGFTKYDRDRTAHRDYRRFGGYDFRSDLNGRPHVITRGSERLTIDPNRFSAGYYSGDLADYVPYDYESQALSASETSTAPEFSRVSGHWAAEYRLLDDDKLTLFTEGYVDYRNMPNFVWNNVPVTVTVAADQYYNPFGEEVTVSYELGEMGEYSRIYKTLNWQGAFGAKGSLGDYNYELVYTQHDRTVERTFRNPWIDRVKLEAALVRDDALAFNPFGYYANSEAQLDLIRGPGGRELEQDQISTIDAKVDGELFTWDAGTAYFAVGYQHRSLSYSYDPDYARQTIDEFGCGHDAGGLANCGQVPYDESRKVNALFAELLVPAYKAGDDEFVQYAEVSAAVRKEKYSDFGSVTIWQASGKMDILDDNVTLRASWSESFKAPSIADLFDPVVTRVDTPEEAFLRDPVRGGVFTTTRILGGNEDLQPEAGTSLNLGIIVKPSAIPDLTVTLDYWSIELDDLIVSPDAQALLNGTSLVGSVTRDGSNHPTLDLRVDNGGTIEASGIDLNISYMLRTDNLGMFSLGLNNTYKNKHTEYAADGVTSIERAGTDLQPKLRSVFSTSWSLDSYEAAVVVSYMDGWKDASEDDFDVDSYVTTDLQLAYNIDESGLRFYAGVENLFDADLPFVISSRDGWARALHDYRGRYFYLGAKKSF